MTKAYKTELSATIHEIAFDLFDHGILDKVTMKEFDASCFIPAETIFPEEIRAIRQRENLSQPVFAQYLKRIKKTCL